MALFFKRIRHKLLISKKFGKYTLYAIGEVLILTLGIGIAVRVNQWDQMQQNRAVEISILKTIKADLDRDLPNLQWDIKAHNDVLASSRIIQDHLENDLTYNDSMPYHFITSFIATFWIYNSGGIQSLKSLGVNTVTNEEIRSDIIQLYDFRYDYMRYLTTSLNTMIQFGEQNILLGRFKEAQFFDDYETEELWDGGMVPLDYESSPKNLL
ncbi:DUF6090 family protein [uncultured Eudoraea sp.]|uniref:DUF6090 family protein n=1 Tax=uncultured Eudoraea sp. TaxID=1035614 RepID=UPI002617F724|nr:DUF6090 family protein [uncultured Eudoraea sp.]